MDENVKNQFENVFKPWKLPKALERELRRGLHRPSWESINEGVHERVNFDDTLWGFTLAGGSYYDTPLRIIQVKPDSRAARAGLRPGDILQTINGYDTSTLTVKEAHDIILESGIHIKLKVAAPDVDETTYHVYQDELENEQSQTNRLHELNKQRQNMAFKGAKTNKPWSIAWPCNKKRDIIYRESNCFLVPSRYEEKHPERILKKYGENSSNYLKYERYLEQMTY